MKRYSLNGWGKLIEHDEGYLCKWEDVEAIDIYTDDLEIAKSPTEFKKMSGTATQYGF